jgi:nitroreductase
VITHTSLPNLNGRGGEKNKMNVIKAIDKKRAVRKYSQKAVSIQTIIAITDAGRKSQSSRNSQPCRFIVVQEKAALLALSHFGNYASHLADASFAIAILTPDPSSNVSILFDAGQAAAYLQLAALELGIVSCVIKLHQGNLGREFLEAPENYRLDFVLSMGFPESKDDIRAKGFSRLDFDDVVYFEKWGVHERLD